MHRLSISCLVALLLAPPGFAAEQKKTILIPETPGLYNLFDKDQFSGVLSSATRRETLRAYLLTPGISAAKLDAVLYQRSSAPGEAEADELEYWTGLDETMDLLDTLLREEKNPEFRRYAVSLIFGGGVYTAVRDGTLFYPLNAFWPKRMDRALAFRDRCLMDGDKGLRDFFERYRPLPNGPDVAAIKRENTGIKKKFLAAHPEAEKEVEESWQLVKKIELSFSDKVEMNTRNIHGFNNLGIEERVAVRRALEEIWAYRIYSAWGAMWRGTLEEADTAKPVDKKAIRRKPLKIGWPDTSFLRPRALRAADKPIQIIGKH